MWPLTGMQVVKACEGVCGFQKLDTLTLTGATTDSRKWTPGDLFVAIKGDTFDGHAFVESVLAQGAPLALVSNAWDGFAKLDSARQAQCVRVPDVLASFRQLARFMRSRFEFPVIGVGGSNGKTTTKEMLAGVLGGPKYKVTKTQKSENGFLGVAITLCSKEHNKAHPPAALVLEIGIDEIGAMEQHVDLSTPDFVLLTALGPEHLAGLKDWQTAANEEFKLFENKTSPSSIWQLADEILFSRVNKVKPGDTLVCEQKQIAELASKLGFSETAETSVAKLLGAKNISLLCYDLEETSPESTHVKARWHGHAKMQKATQWQSDFEIPLPGKHNAGNFALALATTLTVGRDVRDIHAGWETFKPPEMRSRITTLPNGCVLYDDCYNASPASVKAALEVLDAPQWKNRTKIVILGDMLDLGNESKKWHLELVDLLRNLKNSHLCLFGNAMYDLYSALVQKPETLALNKVQLKHMRPEEDPRNFVSNSSMGFENAIVLVKGSRGMDLGRVVSAVRERCVN